MLIMRYTFLFSLFAVAALGLSRPGLASGADGQRKAEQATESADDLDPKRMTIPEAEDAFDEMSMQRELYLIKQDRLRRRAADLVAEDKPLPLALQAELQTLEDLLLLTEHRLAKLAIRLDRPMPVRPKFGTAADGRAAAVLRFLQALDFRPFLNRDRSE